MAFKFSNTIMKVINIPKFNNFVEALYLSRLIRKLCGVSIFVLEVTTDNRVIRKFSYLGFFCFLVWYFIYFYSTYWAHTEDQTILRTLYSTKVKRYGDDFQGVSSTVYVVFSMWKLPYSLSGNTRFVGKIVGVDKALENLGEKIDYNRDGFSALRMSVGQLLIFLFRSLSVWSALSFLEVPIPAQRMFQITYTDALSLISTAHYCYFLIVLTGRFKYINNVLEQIKSQKSWELKMFTRGPIIVNEHKAKNLQDRYLCEKIQACAKMYGVLYRVTEAINKTFGMLLALTMFMCVTNVILYMFYFMEATAAGLFHDVPRYVAFLTYVFWQIGYAFVIIFSIVYLCESAVYETKNTVFLTHEIMNSDFSPSVTAEALQLSVQLLHQKPVFTAHGLYELNYEFAFQATRSVCTYLVILLQFVTETN